MHKVESFKGMSNQMLTDMANDLKAISPTWNSRMFNSQSPIQEKLSLLHTCKVRINSCSTKEELFTTVGSIPDLLLQDLLFTAWQKMFNTPTMSKTPSLEMITE